MLYGAEREREMESQIKYEDRRTEDYRNYGKSLGLLNHIKNNNDIYKLNEHLIKSIHKILSRDIELNNMEVIY